MSPAPKRRHQEVAVRMVTELRNFLRGKPCRVFIAPFDVLLPSDTEDDDAVDTVVQPDISVFCDKSRLTESGARGAPDLIMELLSPSTSKKDLNEKFNLYEKHGVREYWAIDPSAWSIWVYHLGAKGVYDDGELRDRLGDASSIESRVLPGFVVDPVELFADLD